MSHIVSVQTEVRDLTALEQACQKLGLQFDQTATQFTWYAGQRAKCDGVIRVPGVQRAHEVGLVRQKDGGFQLQYDPWAGGYGLEERAGKNLIGLRNEYTAAVTVRTLARQGYRVVRTTDAQGRLQLRAER